MTFFLKHCWFFYVLFFPEWSKLFSLFSLLPMLFLFSHSVLSDSLWPHGLQPARLFCLWDSPGKNTGMGCNPPPGDTTYDLEQFGKMYLCEQKWNTFFPAWSLQNSEIVRDYSYFHNNYLHKFTKNPFSL